MTDTALNVAKSIESYLKIPEESDFLVREAEKAEHGIIEVGSWTGRSSVLLASVAREKRFPFVAVDTWQSCDLEPGKDFFPEWRDNMLRAELVPTQFKMLPNDESPAIGTAIDNFGRFTIVARMPSAMAARLLPVLSIGWGKYDFIFIDADHEYESVKEDFFAWLPNLTRPATVVLHDVNCGHEGVRKFFLELGAAGLETWEEGNIGAVKLKG